MKVKRVGGDASDLTPRGGIYRVQKWRGQTVITAWPRKRGKTHENQQEGVEAMRRVAWMVTHAPAGEITAAMELAAGTPFTWKDILTMSYYGTLYAFITDEGVVLSPWRIAYMSIQTLLDSLSEISGAMIYRTDNGWAALLPGDDETILTMDTATGLPKWKAGSGGGGQTYEQIWTPPAATDFPTKNLPSGASVSDVANGLALDGVLTSTNSNNPVACWQSPPTPGATGWRCRARLVANYPLFNYASVGVWLRNSSSGKLMGLALVDDGQGCVFYKFNSYTSWSSTTNMGRPYGHDCWLGVEYDGTNYNFQWSSDGYQWLTLFSENATTGFIGAADQVGPCFNPNGASAPTAAKGTTARALCASWSAVAY